VRARTGHGIPVLAERSFVPRPDHDGVLLPKRGVSTLARSLLAREKNNRVRDQGYTLVIESARRRARRARIRSISRGIFASSLFPFPVSRFPISARKFTSTLQLFTSCRVETTYSYSSSRLDSIETFKTTSNNACFGIYFIYCSLSTFSMSAWLPVASSFCHI
jgi:hypothetical protein